MITVNLTAQGGINHGELTYVESYTPLYHFQSDCQQFLHSTKICTDFSINLISFECVFKQKKLLKCQSPYRRSAAVTKDSYKSAICFKDIWNDLHICKDQTPHESETETSCFTKTLSCFTSKRRIVTAVRQRETPQIVHLFASMIFWYLDSPFQFQNNPVFRSHDHLFQIPTR